MENTMTRTFKGTYTNKQNKSSLINVRVFSRLAAFAMAITLIHTNFVAQTDKSKNEEATFVTGDFQKDKDLIATILEEKPYILKNVVDTSYTVKEGDTLASIANEFGITPDRIRYLNNLKEDAELYTGGSLKVQKVTDKEGDDELVAALESYFYDYVFKSPAALIASSKNSKNSTQAGYYKNIIFGSPKSEADVDPASIYGRYILAYIAYHDGKLEHKEEETAAYIQALATLAVDLEDALNLHNTLSIIAPFERYKSILKNGLTKDSVPTQKNDTGSTPQKLSI